MMYCITKKKERKILHDDLTRLGINVEDKDTFVGITISWPFVFFNFGMALSGDLLPPGEEVSIPEFITFCKLSAL
jgi:hypothetical protein